MSPCPKPIFKKKKKSWNQITRDKADDKFSLYIRRRDGRCVNPECQRPGLPNAEGYPILGLDCSHLWSRKAESTRFDPKNCDSLCRGCHRYWGSEGRPEYVEFKKKQLGEREYNLLLLRHNTYQKKDRIMALMVSNELLKILDRESA